MADSPVALTNELLHELERNLAAQGVPLEQFKPGLEPHRILDMAQAAGLTLSTEAVTWWQWRNGTYPDPRGLRQYPLGGFLSPMSLDDSIVERRKRLEMAESLSADFDLPSERLWSPSWLPIMFGLSDTYVCDCTPGTTTAVRWISTHNMRPDEYWVVRAASLGEMVARWTDALARGYWRYQATNGTWTRADDQIPEADAGTGLI